ncbi:MAG TPA: MFS transporter [Acidimicrobiales bacterium]|nr:MFS transporter [Acidimicrobiales bacterium]
MTGPVRRPAAVLAVASLAVLLAAADTYVVVVALPAIMAGVGLGLDQLGRATPVVSGYLLGYVAVLPLLGRLSDVAGRRPVFLACLGCFAAGSLVTATAHALAVLVAGRALSGLGGGGLVPVTLSLVADRWPVERRGPPLGVVGAVQELGSVAGPLWGALIVAVASWRALFWVNLPLAGALAVAFATVGRDADRADSPRGPARRRPAGLRPPAAGRRRVAAVVATVGVALVAVGLWAPASLADSVRWGWVVTPRLAGNAWVGVSTPAAVAGLGALIVAAAVAGRARAVGRAVGAVDLPGGLLLAGVLACVVVAFSTADPSRQVVASSAPVDAVVGVGLAAAFVVRQRRAANPLLAAGTLRRRGAWGSLLVNLALGAGLMVALVDVPFFARATRYPDSQVGAALVLARFLVAVPLGALAGGGLLRRPRLGAPVAAAGAALAAACFAWMATWGSAALDGAASDVALVGCGLGFGLAIAPVNAAVLASVDRRAHGLASALAVVARTVGMLAGLSVLTAIGLRQFYEAQARIGSPLRLCPRSPTSCPAYDTATLHALLRELHTTFVGAGLCCAAAAVLAAGLLGGRPGGRLEGRSGLRAALGVATDG